MIKFEVVRFKNFGSFGNTVTEIALDKNKTTLICGNNGSGKCLYIHTKVRLRNRQTGEVFDTTIGEMYAQAEQKHKRQD